MITARTTGTIGVRLAIAAVLSAAPAFAQSPTLTSVIANGESLGAAGTWTGSVGATIGPAGHIVVRGVLNASRNAILVKAPTPGATPTILLTGGVAAATPAPGTPAGVIFGSFSDAWADASGRVFFIATLLGTGVTTSNDNGIWMHNGTSAVLVAREGDPAPGLPAGTIMTTIGSPVFSNGRAAFTTGLSGGGTTTIDDQALWSWNGALTSLVFRKGGASLVSGLTWAGFGGVLINTTGSIAFTATVSSGNTTTDSVVVTGTPSATPLTTFFLAAREGSQAPGATAGIVFNQDFGIFGIGQGGLSFNDSGEVLFHGSLSGGAGTGTWRRNAGGGGTTSSVVRSTDVVPPGIATPSPTTGSPQSETLGGAGVLAWSSTVATGAGGVTVDNDRVLFRKFGASVTPLLREGAQPPGESAEFTFGPTGAGFFIEFSINGAGRMLIEATVTRSTTPGPITAMWGSDPAVPAQPIFKLMKNSDDVGLIGVPGLLAGRVSSPVPTKHGGTQQGQSASINDTGTYVVLASITPPGVSIGGAGTFQGVFTGSIVPGTALGACCVGATCTSTTAAACSAVSSARFAGVGITCGSGALFANCCLADFNQSGAVSVQDVFDYLTAFFAGNLSADINRSGAVSVQDVFDYLAAFFAGCQ